MVRCMDRDMDRDMGRLTVSFEERHPQQQLRSFEPFPWRWGYACIGILILMVQDERQEDEQENEKEDQQEDERGDGRKRKKKEKGGRRDETRREESACVRGRGQEKRARKRGLGMRV